MNAALALLARDLRLALRNTGETLTVLAFFVVAATPRPACSEAEAIRRRPNGLRICLASRRSAARS